MLITLDIYSGRPNPSWLLSNKDAKRLFERVADRALAEESAVEGILGYRGFVATALGDEELPRGMPSSFRVAGPLPEGVSLGDETLRALSSDESDDSALWLLQTGRHVLGDDLQAFVSDQVSTRSLGEGPAEPIADEEEAGIEAARDSKAAFVIANSAYNPAFWNNPAAQPRNNCYNYAMNYRSDTFAQPGSISGHPTGVMACANVATAANWDGCTAVCSGSNHLVALVIWPGTDYHWYRRQREGFWAHKPGGTAVRNTDNAGRVINGTTLKPQNCNRGPYTVFCGYRYAPNKVAGSSNQPGRWGLPVR
ncbi:MAG: hypothetical protein Q8Q28_00290 [Pseudomonadota bacterium]|nr:hypothetical protein [Pseudomonadota bacterium]